MTLQLEDSKEVTTQENVVRANQEIQMYLRKWRNTDKMTSMVEYKNDLIVLEAFLTYYRNIGVVEEDFILTLKEIRQKNHEYGFAFMKQLKNASS